MKSVGVSRIVLTFEWNVKSFVPFPLPSKTFYHFQFSENIALFTKKKNVYISRFIPTHHPDVYFYLLEFLHFLCHRLFVWQRHQGQMTHKMQRINSVSFEKFWFVKSRKIIKLLHSQHSKYEEIWNGTSYWILSDAVLPPFIE